MVKQAYTVKQIKALLTEVSKCKKCPNLKPWNRFPDNAHGKLNSNAMIVSAAPGTKSLQQGKFWSGQAGQRIRKILSNCNGELEDMFYLTDTVKCGLPNDRKPSVPEVSSCKEYLTREITILNPRYILVFGKVAFQYFVGLTDNFKPKQRFAFTGMTVQHNDRGYKLVEFDKFTLIPLLHPSHANQFMTYRTYEQHLKEVFTLIIGSKSIE